MSGLFLVTALATGQRALVRARCLSCARDQMVQSAGAEGTLVWRDPNQSTVEVVRESGKSGVIIKTEIAG